MVEMQLLQNVHSLPAAWWSHPVLRTFSARPLKNVIRFDLSTARGTKPWPKITWSSRLGVDAAAQLLARH